MSHSLSMRYVSLNKCLHTFQVAISKSVVTCVLLLLEVSHFFQCSHFSVSFMLFSCYRNIVTFPLEIHKKETQQASDSTPTMSVQSRIEPSDISGRNDMYFDHFDSTSEVLQTCVSNQQERYIETLNIRPWLAGRM